MRDNNFWVVFDEDLGPEVLDEGIREKAVAGHIVVFLENLEEKKSVDFVRRVRNGLMDSEREEQREHFDYTLLVLQHFW